MLSSRRLLALALCALALSAFANENPVSETIDADFARSVLEQRADALGLTADDIANTEVTDDYVSAHNGVRHVWLRQRIEGLPVALGLVNINLGADGRVWSVNSRFVAQARSRMNSRSPTLSARDAIAAYASKRRLNFDEHDVETDRSSSEAMVFSGGAMSDDDIPVNLSWIEHEGKLHLAWEMVVDEKGRQDWYQAWIDAHDGDVLNAVNWTQEASYRVFAAPLEHPAEGLTLWSLIPKMPRPHPMAGTRPAPQAIPTRAATTSSLRKIPTPTTQADAARTAGRIWNSIFRSI